MVKILQTSWVEIVVTKTFAKQFFAVPKTFRKMLKILLHLCKRQKPFTIYRESKNYPDLNYFIM